MIHIPICFKQVKIYKGAYFEYTFSLKKIILLQENAYSLNKCKIYPKIIEKNYSKVFAKAAIFFRNFIRDTDLNVLITYKMSYSFQTVKKNKLST